MSTGLGPVYDGLGHLLLPPEDILTVIALALLSGLHGPPVSRHMLWLLPVSWAAAGACGLHAGGIGFQGQVPAGVLLLALGGCVALDRPMRGPWILATGCAAGALLGFFDGHAMAAAPSAWLQLAGIAATIFVVLTLLSALVVRLRDSWARIAVRVAGSWIAATGLLLLGWSLRAQP